MFDRVQYVGPELPEGQLKPGDIGYVIEDYGDGNFEVEFSNVDGTTKTIVVLPGQEIELAQA